MRLKHSLRQVEPDRDNLRHDPSPLGIVADPPWHSDAIGDGHVIKAVPRWQKQGVKDAADAGPDVRGAAQGGGCSPLLKVDKRLEP